MLNSKVGVRNKRVDSTNNPICHSRPSSPTGSCLVREPTCRNEVSEAGDGAGSELASSRRKACVMSPERSTVNVSGEKSIQKSSADSEMVSTRSSRRIKPPVPHFSNTGRKRGEVGTEPLRVETPSQPAYPSPNGPMMYPYFYTPMLIPAVYGHVQSQHPNGTTVVYTSGPIPINTNSIVLVPMATMTPSPPPMTPSTTLAGSGSSVSSDPVSLDQPVVVFIERNAFKPWFETNVPSIMQQLPIRLKRYKSVETFMHWLTARKKYESLELNVLIRVTEVNRLLSEVKNTRHLRVFSYEHLFDRTDQPKRSARVAFIEPESLRKDFDQQRLVMSNCLEEACGKLVSLHHQ